MLLEGFCIKCNKRSKMLFYVLLGVASLLVLCISIACLARASYNLGRRQGRREAWVSFTSARRQAQAKYEMSKSSVLANAIHTREKRHDKSEIY